ncbi:MAG: GNAT family N-acetyltransferase [Bacteroidota bacterium]
MVTLKGKYIWLRALEPGDLDFLYQLENDTRVWEISGTTAPYSRHVLKNYLENAHRDIYEVKQLRLCICKEEDVVIGLIDLFDFDPKNKRVGLGIVLVDWERNKGLGSEAIQILCNYVFSTLAVRQLYANVTADNGPSLHLFKKLGFTEAGIKKDWIFSEGHYKDEVLLQKINDSCI